MFENYDDLMTVEQVTEALGLGRNKVYEFLGSQEIKGVRLGRKWRIPRESLTDFIISKSGCKGR